MEDSIRKPQAIVCQRGARRRYAIPRMLEGAGMLAALYTDSSSHSFLGKIACLLQLLGCKNNRVRALADRKPLGIPSHKVFSSDRLAYLLALSHLGLRPCAYADAMAPVYTKWGTQGADIIYTMNKPDLPFLEYARSKGLKVIMDVFIHPQTNEIMDAERSLLTKKKYENPARKELSYQRYMRAFRAADVLLCPSEWVAKGCQNIAPEMSHKIRICPYGSSIEMADRPKSTASKSVLFAGRTALRKGLHYLAAAAAVMRANGVNLDVLVAGAEKESCRWVRNLDLLTFLGQVPMDKMYELFLNAGVFVLPSLSEGQAGVVIEAMATGCPVVITRECGVDIEDGKQGFIVPSRDPYAIADRVMKIISNDDLQLSMSAHALDFAKQFTMPAWSKRLESLCDEVLHMSQAPIAEKFQTATSVPRKPA